MGGGKIAAVTPEHDVAAMVFPELLVKVGDGPLEIFMLHGLRGGHDVRASSTVAENGSVTPGPIEQYGILCYVPGTWYERTWLPTQDSVERIIHTVHMICMYLKETKPKPFLLLYHIN